MSVIDSRWKGLYKIAGVAAIISELVILLGIVTYFIYPYTPGKDSTESILQLLQTDPLGGLISLDIFLFVGNLFSIALFLVGAATAYLFVFAPVLDFLFGFNQQLGIDPDPKISEWLGFVLLLPLGFGVSFQLPLVMLFLERIGVFTVRDYLEKWRISVLVIVVVSAVLTPADPYSIFFMAVPLVFLYFGGIALARFLPKTR